MARKPLGPFSIVPQFDDMLGELGGYVKMPPENQVSEILGDPIFQALGNMWNRIESSEELVVKHQANEVAYMQGAANVGIPIDVMRKLVARVADQHGAALAASMVQRLRQRDLTAVVPGAPPPPSPGAGGATVGAATASRAVGADTASTGVSAGAGPDEPMFSGGDPPDAPGGGGAARVMRDRSSSPAFFPELVTRPPSPPGPPGYGAQISRAQGLDAGTTYRPHRRHHRPSRST